MTQVRTAKFGLGQIVRHTDAAFCGVVVDVDAAYAGPDGDPGPKDRRQPFYQVFVMGAEGGFIAYAAEDVLVHDPEITPMTRADEARWFTVDAAGHHAPRSHPIH